MATKVVAPSDREQQNQRSTGAMGLPMIGSDV